MNALPSLPPLRDLRNKRPLIGSASIALNPAGEFAAYLYAGETPYEALSPTQVVQVEPPRVRTRGDGYGSRLPTAYAACVDGRWRRVWSICWSNSVSYYVELSRAERAQWPAHKRVRVQLPSL